MLRPKLLYRSNGESVSSSAISKSNGRMDILLFSFFQHNFLCEKYSCFLNVFAFSGCESSLRNLTYYLQSFSLCALFTCLCQTDASNAPQPTFILLFVPGSAVREHSRICGSVRCVARTHAAVRSRIDQNAFARIAEREYSRADWKPHRIGYYK